MLNYEKNSMGFGKATISIFFFFNLSIFWACKVRPLSELSAKNQSEQDVSSVSDHCLPRFPLKDGWLGGDAIYSVKLEDKNQRILWLFADTFYNLKDHTKRQGGGLIFNSIGVSTCKDNLFDIQYYWQPDSDPQKAKAFFSGDDHDTWPGDGIIIGDKLYIFGIRRHPNDADAAGTRLLIVESFSDTPANWRQRFKDFPTGKDVLVGVSAVKSGDYVLLFSSLHRLPQIPMTLFRCPLSNIEDCHPELLTDSGWELYAGDLAKAKKLLVGAGTEFSVERIENQWVAVYASVERYPIARTINAAYSSNEEEPFSNSKVIKVFPTNQEVGTKSLFCYAAKEHPELRLNTVGVVTFICNSTEFFAETVRNLSVYQVYSFHVDLKP